MNHPLPLILAATLGAGSMLVLTPATLPQACEPVELLRFVSNPPEIHIVQQATFGRLPLDWLQQFNAEPEPDLDPEPIAHRRRRHAR